MRRPSMEAQEQAQYYMSGANATVIKEKMKKVPLAKNSSREKQKKAVYRTERSWSKVSVFAIIFVLALLVVGEFALVQGLGLEVSQAQGDLHAIQAKNESFRNEISELSDLNRVEKIAREDLKMVKPEQVYTYTPSQVAGPEVGN